MAKLSTDDLTVGQMESIEEDIGPYPWVGVSKFKVMVKVLSAITGEPEQTFRDMKLPELLERVTLDPEAADPNASGASGPAA